MNPSPLARREMKDYHARRRQMILFNGSRWRRFMRWLGRVLP